ncbi:hypothetical protein BHE90_000584 [Fusarium euwallaceae]|uniref:Uncharacterized protein n=1 Tax=Fusarium euwallaceae TaxID=1147111 RepID=A0A430MA98_9HYPO|nr:hypothetical protein BHE90_000584 [Fusarium euwallaceae]
MPSLPVVHITGPNGEQVPVCPFPFPAAADELVSLEEWLKHFPSPAPKPTKADDGFDVDKATFDEIWASIRFVEDSQIEQSLLQEVAVRLQWYQFTQNIIA